MRVRILFILKNAIWAVIDFLTILSCGGDGGVMCFFAPLRHVNGLSGTVQPPPSLRFRVQGLVYDARLHWGGGGGFIKTIVLSGYSR